MKYYYVVYSWSNVKTLSFGCGTVGVGVKIRQFFDVDAVEQQIYAEIIKRPHCEIVITNFFRISKKTYESLRSKKRDK